MFLGVPSSVYVMWKFFVKEDDESRPKFIDNVRKRVPKRPAIIVQEELERKYVRSFAFFIFHHHLSLLYLSHFFLSLADLDEHVASQERCLRSPDLRCPSDDERQGHAARTLDRAQVPQEKSPASKDERRCGADQYCLPWAERGHWPDQLCNWSHPREFA